MNDSRTVPAKVVGEPSVPSGLLRSVVRYFNPRKVILLGLRAPGEADENSDIDLLFLDSRW